MAVGISLREGLAKFVPTWLQKAPGFRNLFSFTYMIAVLGDCLREIAWQGQMAAYPGVGTPTALPLIAVSRALLQGPNETNANFSKRLIAWLTTWTQAGSAQSLAEQIQAFLVQPNGTYPVVIVVDRQGSAPTLNADQSVTFSSVSWNWDEVGGLVDATQWNPPSIVDGWWSDLWVIVQDFSTHYTSFTDPNWLAAWNSGDQTIDGLVPQATVQGVMDLVRAWKGAHTYVRSVIFVANPTAFLSTPNGLWGNASRNIGGVQAQERSGANAYWDPVGGG